RTSRTRGPPDRQRQLIGRNRLLHVLGPLAEDAVTIGVSAAVLRVSPVDRQRLARSDRQRQLIGRNRLLHAVGPVALAPMIVGRADAEPKPSLDVLAKHRKLPCGDRRLECESLLTKLNPFLGDLLLLPALIKPGEIGSLPLPCGPVCGLCYHRSACRVAV